MKEFWSLPGVAAICEGDCVEMPYGDNAADLQQRHSGGVLDYRLKGQDWVDWCVPRFRECLRVTKGLVAWVVEGKTRQFRHSATQFLLMADLHRADVKLRKPPIFHRVGIPGSGGPDWLRNDYELIICASNGKLPWSDNTAMGHPVKYETGGRSSNRTQDGRRANKSRYGALDQRNGPSSAGYAKPKSGVANPGNVIKCKVGGGLMGSPLAHENEAPFPESLAEFFVRSFCPHGGTVLDPFSGSGTTVAVAIKNGRKALAIDIRESQCELTKKRVEEAVSNSKSEKVTFSVQ